MGTMLIILADMGALLVSGIVLVVLLAVYGVRWAAYKRSQSENAGGTR